MKTKVAEIISIGNEVLAGYTVNTNASFISQQLISIGLPVQWVTTISDHHDDIIFALKTANQRADAVLITGGLGPTPDDITKVSICEFFKTRLIEDKDVLNHVQNLLKNRGLNLLESNIAQALVPEKAEVLHNPVGTAPGLVLKKSGCYFFFMPGVPMEMKRITTEQVIPYLQKNIALPTIENRLLRTTGIAESRLYEKLKDILDEYSQFNMAFLPRHIGVDLRFRLVTEDKNEQKKFEAFVKAIQRKAAKYIFTENDIELEEVLGQILQDNHLTLSCGESFTGGMIGDLLTNIPGSSAYFMGGIITYSNESKIHLLSVKKDTIETFGAVSWETAVEMVRGVQKVFDTDCAIATTGIAGPTGATQNKPVGLCFIAARYGEKEIVKKFQFSRDRIINKRRGTMAAMELLRRMILNIITIQA